LAACFTLMPFAASAAGLVPCNGPDCEACDLVKLGQNVINFLIEISAAVGALMFAIGGFMMVTSGGDSGKVKTATGIMTNVVIGFIILLAAWLIVDTVMKTFVGERLGRPWNEIQCVNR
jgi:hypothetical protein